MERGAAYVRANFCEGETEERGGGSGRDGLGWVGPGVDGGSGRHHPLCDDKFDLTSSYLLDVVEQIAQILQSPWANEAVVHRFVRAHHVHPCSQFLYPYFSYSWCER